MPRTERLFTILCGYIEGSLHLNIRKDLRSQPLLTPQLLDCLLRWRSSLQPASPPQGVEAPTEAVVTLTPTKFTFELESEPENVQDLKLIIQASAPQSNGVTRAYSKAVQIGGVLEAVTEEYDIKEDYDNKHGAPNAAAPKIFMKYFFVNTKTGEKSGEMLTMVRLDEDAPAEGE